MENPEWQKQMKEMANSKDFKENLKKTKDLLQDPNTAAHAEAKIEHMVKVGQEQLKQNAASVMEQAMQSMNDPAMMEEMAKMVKDPNFTKQLQEMYKNPEFRQYIDAMQDMVKDPSKRAQFEAISQKIAQKAEL